MRCKKVEWDYAPSGDDLIKGGPLEDNPDAVVFVEDTDLLIGRKYMKVRAGIVMATTAFNCSLQHSSSSSNQQQTFLSALLLLFDVFLRSSQLI